MQSMHDKARKFTLKSTVVYGLCESSPFTDHLTSDNKILMESILFYFIFCIFLADKGKGI
jgi:hypothetical protein